LRAWCPIRAWGFKSPLRHQLSHLRHAHSVCRIRRFLGHVLSETTLWVARRVCGRHPPPDTTEGVFGLVIGLWQQRVSPCKRLANTSEPMGDAGRATIALTRPTDPAVCLPQRGGSRQRCRPMGRSGEFAVSDPAGIRLVRRRGAVVISAQDGRDAGRPRGSGRSATPTPDRRRAPDAVRCSAPRARPPTFWRG
jgi:hypothetical protein